VRITRRFGIGKDPVTQSQYAEVMGTNPSHFQHAGPDAPVEQVSWEDALEFCRRLTRLDRQSGKLLEGYEYTLPTEAQWEYACRAGTEDATYAGDLQILGECNAPALDPIAWYSGNSGVDYEGGVSSSEWPKKQYDHQHAGIHPVGEKQPNASGLHDMLGDVWEWCADWYGDYSERETRDPRGPDKGSHRVVRGGAWNRDALGCRSACRSRDDPGERLRFLGFRVAAVQSAALQAREREGRPRARELVWLEPGEFMMGSPENEAGRIDNERQHQVRITRRFALGKDPVTQSQYEEVMGTNPSYFQHAGPDAPVEQVSWEEAMEYCRRLTERDRQSGALPEGYEYSLPTEAQWEYACRAGSKDATYAGDLQILGQHNAPVLDPISWYGGNSGVDYEGGVDSSGWSGKQYDHQRAGTHPVGQKQPNASGLHDMLGNVWEWCYDWYGAYTTGDAFDPTGPATGSYRVVRGGAWYDIARGCRSACRNWGVPGNRARLFGFRLAAVQSAQRQASEPEGRRRARES
jgi:formylglycine-generating enzyme required for sulfatase activity